MPQYINNPFARPALLQKGVPTYLIGSFNMLAADANCFVTNSALTSDVATLSITLLNGPKPAVGDLISVINSTNGSGVFNVNRAIITSVTWTDSTGSGTVTFALSSGNVSSAADTGSVIIEQPEVPEALAAGAILTMSIDVAGTLWAVGDQFTISGVTNGLGQVTAETGGVPSAIEIVTAGYGGTTGTGKSTTAQSPSTGTGLTANITVSGSTYVSMAAVVQAPQCDSQFTIPMSVLTDPTAITAMTATLQRAIMPNSNAAEWTNTAAVVTIASSAYTAGPTVLATLERGYMYRIDISTFAGAGNVVGKIG